SWKTIASDLYSTSVTWNVTTLNDGTVILLKVQAEDSAGFVSFTISDNTLIVNPELTSTSSTISTTANITSAWSIAILLFSLFFILIKRKKEKL
ncbi:MAG: hypothetical protein ACFFDI_31325, partial [Promethearchaeota archaeon]